MDDPSFWGVLGLLRADMIEAQDYEVLDSRPAVTSYLSFYPRQLWSFLVSDEKAH